MLVKKKKVSLVRMENEVKDHPTIFAWDIAPKNARTSSSKKVTSLQNVLCLSGDNRKPQRSHPLS